MIHAWSAYIQWDLWQYTTYVPPAPAIDESNFRDERVWVVLGASVSSTGKLSPAVQQRVDKVYELYIQGIISKILISGYDQDENYLEATSMRFYLTTLGVPRNDMLVDHDGYDTLASIQDIKDYGISQAIVVSQQYHLYRAMFYTDYLDDDVLYIAISADYNPTRRQKYANSREILARVKAFIEMSFIDRDLQQCWNQKNLNCKK